MGHCAEVSHYAEGRQTVYKKQIDELQKEIEAVKAKLEEAKRNEHQLKGTFNVSFRKI